MPTSIDETELARLEALAAGATTFPWKGDGHKECGYGWVKIPGFNTTGTERSARLGQYLGADDDARYIAAACNAVPALIAEIRRLREKVEAWEWWEEVQNYSCIEHPHHRFRFMDAEMDPRAKAYANAMSEYNKIYFAARRAVHADRE